MLDPEIVPILSQYLDAYKPENFLFNCTPRNLEYVLDDINIKAKRPVYAGRLPAASPATGLMKIHVEEQNKLVNWALNTPLDEIPQPFKRLTKLAAE